MSKKIYKVSGIWRDRKRPDTIRFIYSRKVSVFLAEKKERNAIYRSLGMGGKSGAEATYASAKIK